MRSKVKLAIGLGSTCSGSDIYVLDLKEKMSDLAALADIPGRCPWRSEFVT